MLRLCSPFGGSSTLMTSAPRSTIRRVACGPASHWVKSRIRTPARMWVGRGTVSLLYEKTRRTAVRPFQQGSTLFTKTRHYFLGEQLQCPCSFARIHAWQLRAHNEVGAAKIFTELLQLARDLVGSPN